MHDYMILRLKEFISERFKLTQSTKLIYPPKYLNLENDEFFQKLLAGISESVSIQPEILLDEFGSYLAPLLAGLYKQKGEWNILDLLEYAEKEIHKNNRNKLTIADPARLKIIRINRLRVEIIYSSPRNLPHLGVGIIKGLASYLNEKIVVEMYPLPDHSHLITVEKIVK